MPLSVEEKMRTRYHLGYPQIGTFTVMALGVPAAGQTQFILERQMDHILPEAEPKLREVLCECDRIETTIKDARQRLSVERSGDVRFRVREELEDLYELYEVWTDTLADMLAAVKNPRSARHFPTGATYLE